MICQNCGKEVPETAKVCGYCGTRLRLDEETVTRVETGPPSSPADRSFEEKPTRVEDYSAGSERAPAAPTRLADLRTETVQPSPALPVDTAEKGRLPGWAGFLLGVVAVGAAAVAVIFLMGGLGSQRPAASVVVTEVVYVPATDAPSQPQPPAENQPAAEAPVLLPTDTSEPAAAEPVQETSGNVYFTALETMFCRAGPGVEYEDYWMANEGQVYRVLAAWHENSSWRLIEMDDPGTRTKCCWIGGSGALDGSPSAVPLIDYLPDRMTCELP